MIELVLHLVGLLLLLVVGGVALVALVLWTMRGTERQRALPRGVVRNLTRVTQVQAQRAHAEINADDHAYRRELAERRL